jgi:hypothetical protein
MATKRAMSEREIEQRIGPLLATLLQSAQYARIVGRSTWEFAVEIASLRTGGITSSDLRFVLSRGYAEHAIEVTKPSSRKRLFREMHNLALPDKSCFVLTELGEQFAQRVARKLAKPRPHPTPPA